MPEPLTTLERRILDYLIEYLRRNTYQPSIREIGRRFDIKSTKTVSEYLQALADKGWIERDPSRSRGVRLLGLDLSAETVSVPCYPAGDAAGGPLAGTVEQYELDRKLAGYNGTFFVPMSGDSMAGAGIHEGDLLLVEPVPPEEVQDGDLVLASLAGKSTVRRFRRADAETPDERYAHRKPALVGRAGSLEIRGRVIGVYRRLRAPLAAPAAPAGSSDVESGSAV